jgi:hypothetical protein
MKEKIFNITTKEEFEKTTLEIFRIQSEKCIPYRDFINLVGIKASSVNSIDKIPFLPVSLFKSHSIICHGLEPEIIFTSSATSGMIPSSHPVADLSIYRESFSTAFRRFWGEPSEYAILALLPSYLEREGSSLVYMADSLIKESRNSDSGFYLYDFGTLYQKLISLKERGIKTLLLGVSFALLEFIDQYQINFPELIVMETGGMKGRGKEISRDQLHSALKSGFGVSKIASEYGMAELLSQAYSYGDGLFETPPWMEILIRDLSNPFRILNGHATGGINIIDLANINSCSFVETQDMGKKEAGNTFSISGRIQNSELRGCNLLFEQ